MNLIVRQMPMGRFVADFGCHSAKLIIELDGPFHDPGRDRHERDAWFAKAGYQQALRFRTRLSLVSGIVWPNDIEFAGWRRGAVSTAR